MSLIYLMLQMTPALMLLILIIFFISIGVGGTWTYRKYIRPPRQESGNDLVGDIFAVVGGLYGLLLGFIVFLVWDSFNTAEINAHREGSMAKGLYRAIRYHPDSAQMAPLSSAYMRYVNHVIYHEYPHMEAMQGFTKEDRQAFNVVFKYLEKVNAGDARTEQMFRHLNELATYRSLRQLDAVTEISSAIWLALLTGGIVVLIFAMILEVESMRLHLLANGLLSTFIGLIVYIILILDHPFTGSMKIQSDDYQQILIMAKEDL